MGLYTEGGRRKGGGTHATRVSAWDRGTEKRKRQKATKRKSSRVYPGKSTRRAGDRIGRGIR